ncbi:MAG: hypothetical protein EVA68_06200 [OM182 bacterium]|uniref:DUF3718 domain-containing protein n=1 Tax=OM182 bacterium TaxID=2510334 RepID=A0A520RZX1_9GAMM|nr:MAG: hypothetical protein EVA68_06200 [OM182 bacterium]
MINTSNTIAVMVTLVFSLPAMGEYSTRNKDENAKNLSYVTLCNAARESRSAMLTQAKELKISRQELKRIACDDIPIRQFARQNRETEPSFATVE